MRLIDADDFFARMENDTDLCAEMEADGLKALKKYLDIQPTAYDVDKVVEKLEEIQDKAVSVKNKDISIYATGMMGKTIEIVKAGAVND